MKENPNFPILIIDDEQEVLFMYESYLLTLGYNNIVTCLDSRQVMDILKENSFSVVLLDLNMPYITGEILLSMINENYPEIPVIVITATDDLNTAVRCMKMGAYDFFLKSAKIDAIGLTVSRAIKHRALKEEISSLRGYVLNQNLKHPEVFGKIITNNKKMLSIFNYIEAISSSWEPVLITGENGVGKELIAQAIHSCSQSEGKWIALNVSALDEHQFSDTLFGHKKGAFTGADSNRKGLVEQARGTTLFLDEIGDLNKSSQVKLLRLIQEKEYYPLGSDILCRANTRIITATNQDLKTLISNNVFRKDLYYRLSGHKIEIPPLRERMDDLNILIDYFIDKISKECNKKKVTVPLEVIDQLNNYTFPGNIRELESIIKDAIYTTKTKELSVETIKTRIKNNTNSKVNVAVERNENKHTMNNKEGGQNKIEISFHGKLPSIKEATDLLVDEALRRTNGNKSRAAKLLGISHQAISKRLKKRSLTI